MKNNIKNEMINAIVNVFTLAILMYIKVKNI